MRHTKPGVSCDLFYRFRHRSCSCHGCLCRFCVRRSNTAFRHIETWDHWIAFAMLSLVGLNMLREAWFGEEEESSSGDPTRGVQLVMLAVATSIDAMAVGLSFAMIGVPVWGPSIIIGLVCAAVTAAGVKLGRILGGTRLLGNKVAVLGGLVLIGIGIKILHEHGVL